MRLELGVNIDHVATLRQARAGRQPDVVEAARIAEAAGAHGITVHLREDRRHIQDADVYSLRRVLRTSLNLEMAHTPEIVAIALDVRPDEVCLVPEKRREVTTEGGLDAASDINGLAPTVHALNEAGIRTSLFIDPDPPQVAAAAALQAPCIELHTGSYANADGSDRTRELDRLVQAAEQARGLGLQVNAGHGLDLENIEALFAVPYLHTLNIGHSIVARAVFVGLAAAIREMLDRMKTYGGPFSPVFAEKPS
jgi:pyridoxine 5-phosphate synthase